MSSILRTAAALLCGAALTGSAWAQAWPAKPIRFVIPFGPGGIADLVSRTVAPKLSEALGQPLVIENQPGAGGVLAAQTVARAEPDGHTLLLITNGNAISQALFKSLPYDPLNDFAMISTIGYFSLVVITDPKSTAKTLQEIIAQAKASPGKLNIGTITAGSTQHLAAELFRSTAGVDMQMIPYKSTGEVVAAVKQQDAHIAFEFLAPATPHVRSGNLRALAVTAGKRFAGLPEVPTAIESGLAGYEVTSWNALAAPARTPRAVIERLQQEVAKALALLDVQKRFLDLGVEGRASSPEHLREFFISESQRWGRVIEAAKIPKR